jgi:hypothetical protein
MRNRADNTSFRLLPSRWKDGAWAPAFEGRLDMDLRRSCLRNAERKLTKFIGFSFQIYLPKRLINRGRGMDTLDETIL